MKILTAPQIRLADQYTIEHEPIASIELMERAAQKVVEVFCNDYQPTHWIKHIFCGTGNNGGDGLAIARMLFQAGHHVKVYLLPGNPSRDYIVNLDLIRKQNSIELQELSAITDLPAFSKTDVIIDAILGTGLNKPLEGIIKGLIDHLNASQGIKVAIDIPTGLFADQSNEEGDSIFEADRVYTFHAPKLAFLLPQNGRYVKRFKILDIRLSREFTESADSQNYFLEKKDIQERYRPRDKFTHKGTCGHSLLIAGSRGKMGAAVLSAQAALRAGTGLLTVHTPGSGNQIVQISVPEALSSSDSHPDIWTQLPDTRNKTIGIGPGLGTAHATQAVFRQLLLQEKDPMVIDADALNLISLDPTLLRLVPVKSILTPHPKEFERLAGEWEDDFERLALQRTFSIRHQVVIVLKGAHSSISDTYGNIYFNATGNSGMATGGTGDVLTGILTALLAQGYDSIDAALIGTYIHGLAGNHSLDQESKESIIASDITRNLGKAFKFIRQ